MRQVVSLVALVCAGCDVSFGLLHFDPPAIDAPTLVDDGSTPDTPDPTFAAGCSDGRREGFPDPFIYPSIAACAGAWTLPGLVGDKSGNSGCSDSGDDGNTTGAGCSAADVCADGWHICDSAAEVATHLSVDGCSTQAGEGFFATNQSASGGNCALPGDDDIFGCGTGGALVSGCTPLDKTSEDHCSAINVTGWSCQTGPTERLNVTKSDATFGGVLCCRD